MNYKLLVLGAGGGAGIGMTRCLKDFEVYGQDSSEWARRLMEVPEWKDEEIDLVVPVPSKTILKYPDKAFLPPKEVIELCWDKDRCAEVLGNLAPKSFKAVWYRDINGSGGKGATLIEAKDGKMISEYLPGRNISCEVVYNHGKLEGYFQKLRISYSSGGVQGMVAGIGTSIVSKCIDEPKILELTEKALHKLMPEPHGVFGVDFKEDENGEPKITEINAGRFLTASYIYYYMSGYNLPKRMVELALGLPLTPLAEYPLNKLVIKAYDRLPYYGL